MGEIFNLSKEINFDNLIYYFKSKSINWINVISIRGPLNLYENIIMVTQQ